MKRIFSLVLTFAMVLACSCSMALAINVDTKASLTLSDYEIVLKAGSRDGEIRINYDVTSSKAADSVGVSSIDIYKSNGSFVTTITGTTRNGLIAEDTSSNMGVHSYIGTSGTSYYAEVTVFAEIGSDYDSRTVTTATVKAP